MTKKLLAPLVERRKSEGKVVEGSYFTDAYLKFFDESIIICLGIRKSVMEEQKTTAYPAEIRLFAKGIYLQGNSYNETAKIVKRQFPGARCNAETIRRWASKEDWDVKRIALEKRVDEIQEQDVVEVLKHHRELYDRLIVKGEEGLGEAEIRTASEAGNLIDTGIKGQRGAMRELLSIEFVKRVFDAVSSEVPDPEVRRRIANKLRTLIGAGNE